MRIAIVGSRGFRELYRVRAFVSELPEGTTVISGEAPGVDREAKRAALARGLPYEGYPADWETHGLKAGFLRNRVLVEKAEAVVAFWDGSSRGTKHSIDLARKAGKKVTVFRQGMTGSSNQWGR